MSIPFTQFMLPNGRRVQVSVDRSSEVEEKAQKLISEGFAFEVEILRNGVVNMDCNRGDVILGQELATNDTDVPEKVDRLVNKAYERFLTGAANVIESDN